MNENASVELSNSRRKDRRAANIIIVISSKKQIIGECAPFTVELNKPEV